MMYYLYVIINVVNDNCYVGYTKNPNLRWNQHKSEARNRKKNHPLYNSMKLHGICNFVFQIFEENNDLQYIKNKEISIIKFFRESEIEVVYNVTDGGEGASGHVISEEN